MDDISSDGNSNGNRSGAGEEEEAAEYGEEEEAGAREEAIAEEEAIAGEEAGAGEESSSGEESSAGEEEEVEEEEEAEEEEEDLPIHKADSIEIGKKLFASIIHPTSLEKFFRKYWEKKPLRVKRKQGGHLYSEIFSHDTLFKGLFLHDVDYTHHIEITSWEEGKVVKQEPKMMNVMPSAVHEFFAKGMNIQFKNPEIVVPSLIGVNVRLQEYFHCRVLTNAFLIPPNKHYFGKDELEMFVFQIEGRSRWRLSKPPGSAHVLPRYKKLKPGDMLYIPRGIEYQAYTDCRGCHSLHLTLSLRANQYYENLFAYMIPLMLEHAIATDLDLRRGLPLHTWRNAGRVFNNVNTQERSDMLEEVTRLFKKSLTTESIADFMDATVDQLAKLYHYFALPPQVLLFERPHTIYGTHADIANGQIMYAYKITGRTNVRLLRANIMRLVKEESWHIYYYGGNTKLKIKEQISMKINNEMVENVKQLIRSYPEYVGVSQLRVGTEESKVEFLTKLFKFGLLMVEEPAALSSY